MREWTSKEPFFPTIGLIEFRTCGNGIFTFMKRKKEGVEEGQGTRPCRRRMPPTIPRLPFWTVLSSVEAEPSPTSPLFSALRCLGARRECARRGRRGLSFRVSASVEDTSPQCYCGGCPPAVRAPNVRGGKCPLLSAICWGLRHWRQLPEDPPEHGL